MDAINKQEFIERVAEKASIGRIDATIAVEGVVDVLREAFVAGQPVKITGFGTFEVSHREGRTVKNMHADEMVEVKPYRLARFKPSKNLKDEMAVVHVGGDA